LNNANYKDKDLIIFNGDMVSEFKDEQTIFNGFMKESIDLFASEKPMYYARGNHETRGEFTTSKNIFHPKNRFCIIFSDRGLYVSSCWIRGRQTGFRYRVQRYY
ncbi:MAG: metallophosphoesterase, partial [Parabacteroides johnsonii]